MKKLALIFLFSGIATANEQSGSLNTYNGDDSIVSSNNTTTDDSVTNNYNGAGSSSEMPVGSAISPSYMSNGVDTCLKGTGGSLQTMGVGISKGGYAPDPDCSRRRDAKLLADLGMKVGAISRMCQSIQIFRAMLLSGTPCPIIYNGRLVAGKKAILMFKQKPELYIPDYAEDQEWYNGILKIGEVETNEKVDSDLPSDMFRRTKQRTTESD